MKFSMEENKSNGTTTVMVFALVVSLASYIMMILGSECAALLNLVEYKLIFAHLFLIVFLLVVLSLYNKAISKLDIGSAFERESILPAAAVLSIYLVDYIYAKLTGQPAETWVVESLNQPMLQTVSLFITILLLAPIGEEILFRGVLLNVFCTSRAWMFWVGVVLISLLFSALHVQYQQPSTFVQLFTLSAALAWARQRSGGLLLPILLHSFASVLAVIFTLLN